MTFVDCAFCGGQVHTRRNVCVKCGEAQVAKESRTVVGSSTSGVYEPALDRHRHDRQRRSPKVIASKVQTDSQRTSGRTYNQLDGNSDRNYRSRKDFDSPEPAQEDRKSKLSPIVKQSLLTAVFLFGMFIIYQAVTGYLRAAALQANLEKLQLLRQTEQEEQGRLKQAELERSGGVVYSTRWMKHSTCEEWNNFHGKRRGLDAWKIIQDYSRKCTDRGYR